jgi:hypothetical protein
MADGRGSAHAQTAADDANKSNNPLNLAASFNLQNYFTPSYTGHCGRISSNFAELSLPALSPD